MISRSGVHLPDTTYGGNPIHWNCADDLNGEPRNLQAENAELKKLCAEMWETITEHNRVTFAKLLRFGERLVKLGVIE